MQSTSWEMWGWKKHKLESSCQEKYQQPQIYRWWKASYGRKQRGTKEPLDEGERGERKGWLKTQHSKKLRSWHLIPSDQIRSVGQSCPTLCDPMNRSTPGLPVHHQLPEFTQTHVHRVSDAIQPSHSLSSPSPLAPNPSQYQSLFQWVNSSHEVAKVLEFQL